jgi:hemerythrin-like domain-containing protein
MTSMMFAKEKVMEDRIDTKPTPLNAMPSAAHGYHDSKSATALLSDEHRVIERVLAVLEKLTRRPVAQSLDTWQKALEFICGFADGCHHLKEEKALFPALEDHGVPIEGGPLGMMLMEHEEGRVYVKSMLAALTDTQTESAQRTLIDNASAYIRLLKSHIEKEDEVLFRMADDVLPPEEQKQLLRAFEEHEAQEVGAGVHEKYLKIVEELERSM